MASPAFPQARHQHRVVRVSPSTAIAPSEVSVAINPARPENVVAVSLQRRSPTADYAYVSFDGGTTWVSIEGQNPNARTQGDDAIVFDDAGRAYWSYISFNGFEIRAPHGRRDRNLREPFRRRWPKLVGTRHRGGPPQCDRAIRGQALARRWTGQPRLHRVDPLLKIRQRGPSGDEPYLLLPV